MAAQEEARPFSLDGPEGQTRGGRAELLHAGEAAAEGFPLAAALLSAHLAA
jgi:hypothetical protein